MWFLTRMLAYGKIHLSLVTAGAEWKENDVNIIVQSYLVCQIFLQARFIGCLICLTELTPNSDF